MKNVKLSVKLGLSFGCILLCALVIGYFANKNSETSIQDNETMGTVYIPTLNAISNVREAFQGAVSQMIRLVNAGNPDVFPAAREGFNATERAHQKVKQLILNSPELAMLRPALTPFETMFANYVQLSTKSYELYKQEQALFANLTNVFDSSITSLSAINAMLVESTENDINIGITGNIMRRLGYLMLTDKTATDIKNAQALLLKAQRTHDPKILQTARTMIQQNIGVLQELASTLSTEQRRTTATKGADNLQQCIALIDAVETLWAEIVNIGAQGRVEYEKGLVLMAEAIKTVEQLVAKNMADNIASATQSRQTLFMIEAVVIVVGILLTILISRSVTGGIARCAHFAQRIAQGDLSSTLNIQQKDEVGQLAEALRKIPQELHGVMDEYTLLAQNVTVGKIDARGQASKFSGDFADLIHGTNNILDRYVAIIDNIASPVVLLDKNQCAQYLNKVARDLVGMDYKTQTCKQLFNREDSGTPQDSLDKAIRTLQQSSGETVAHPRGKTLHIQYTAVPLLDDKKQLSSIIQLITDISDIKRSQETMQNVANNAADIAQRSAEAAGALSTQIRQAEVGTNDSSLRMEEIATAMAEMNSTVLEVARNAGTAAGVANEARSKADNGSRDVDAVIVSIGNVERQASSLKDDMSQLNQQADAIGAIMNVISDIADQTNLLALNAAIEAARAGEAGRGFAVVADEVRKLAEKTMQATVEVGNAINNVQKSVDRNMQNVDASVSNIVQATEQARHAGASLHEIVDLVDASADQIRMIATAAEEQSVTSNQINHSLEMVSNTASETAMAMGESAHAITDLAEQVERLNRLISQLHHQ